MTELTRQRCEACRAGAPQATQDEIAEYMPQIPDWEIIEVDGVKRLQRVYKFKNFAQALEFAGKVGAIAEEQDHHPSILV
ncbi:MAG: 4a-hydroxytetrahydrobiopterin dehydratase, partial [Arenicellales bacterium]